MSGIDPKQLLKYVIEPALSRLQPIIPLTKASTQLVLGTAHHESGGLVWLDQRDKADKPGPAYGLWQMEKITFEDHLRRLNPALEPAIFGYMSRIPSVEDLHWNLCLGAAICRILYYHAPDALPAEGDALGMTQFWKKRYNTPLGAGTVEQALPSFQLACRL